MKDLVKSSGNASKRARKAALKELKKKKEEKKTRRTHVYFLMVARENRCIEEKGKGGTLGRSQGSGAVCRLARFSFSSAKRMPEGEGAQERKREGK